MHIYYTLHYNFKLSHDFIPLQIVKGNEACDLRSPCIDAKTTTYNMKW